MATKPQILAENEYTIRKLIERVGANKDTWRKYLLLDKFKNSIEIIESRVNLFKFKMLISEVEFKQLFTQEKLINQKKSVMNAMIKRGRLPIRKPKVEL